MKERTKEIINKIMSAVKNKDTRSEIFLEKHYGNGVCLKS